MLIVPNLKKNIQVEWSTFNKWLQNQLNGHCVEAKEIPFFEIMNDGAELKNNHKCQDFGMKLIDRIFRCRYVIKLWFRISSSSEQEKDDELVEEGCTEVIDKEINKTFDLWV